MARVEGFEPPTAWFVARYSIQLSYGRKFRTWYQTPITLTSKNQYPGGERGIRTLDEV